MQVSSESLYQISTKDGNDQEFMDVPNFGQERVEQKINLDLDPISRIITDIIKKNYVRNEFKYQITEDGSGRMLGERDDSRFPIQYQYNSDDNYEVINLMILS